eukprot:CAMPEP_0176402636 /NCGR_PEP_ID=MMETSP0126-20121128/49435_1 /TAXON_ID=141414 ORGANISM="Strombidinopsis acuminatum, Strain SPMC142" /NCGR_SAMPLE_ID=MMETSP0126 /ASSEMBLY_ACC=CAM_ASM_000229 /LENGTH=50 /DNA_ID=CAMNT_0017780369 /DNA_START=92 /DNA_END=244 /DNA_ORIENTATION=+
MDRQLAYLKVNKNLVILMEISIVDVLALLSSQKTYLCKFNRLINMRQEKA